VSLKHLILIPFVLVFNLPAFALNGNFQICERMLLERQKPRPEKTFELFKKGKPVKNYNDLVSDIRAGDDLMFEGGQTFHVEHRFGAGMTTLILDIGNDELLRVPLYVTTHPLDQNPLLFIVDFQQMQPELVANGVPVVEMVTEKIIPDKAVVVKKEKLEFSLEDFLKGRDGDGEKLKLSKEDRKDLEKKLVQFARKTWMYERIGDFRTSEIAYNGTEWLIIDIGDDHYPHKMIEDLKTGKNIFSPYSRLKDEYSMETVKAPQLPDKLYEKVKDAIKEERNAQRKNPKLFQQIQKRGAYKRSEE
jgi:hypothetical protein